MSQGRRAAGSATDGALGRSLTWAEHCVERRTSRTADHALRLLARWLVSAARKGAPTTDSHSGEGPQNCLDVARDTEVVSKPEAGAMPVQQAIQRNTL